ncbi:MAG: ankyrin repeat domain-containing protein [Alphaproteobacteria bacterium]|nr:ankyrin repeat domain-containing protein [Alphaproteobacteria bacterium]
MKENDKLIASGIQEMITDHKMSVLLTKLKEYKKKDPKIFSRIDEMGEPMMCWASAHADVGSFNHLKDYFSLAVVNKDGDTPLHIALKNKNFVIAMAMVRFLPQDVANAKNADGKTALHLATEHADHHTFSFLTQFVNPNIVDKEGKTPLHYAVETNNIEIGLFISAYFPNCVEVTDHEENTPFHYAARLDKSDMFMALMSGKSMEHIGMLNNAGMTAVQIAEKSNHEGIINAYEKGKKAIYLAKNKYFFHLENKDPPGMPEEMMKLAIAAKNEDLFKKIDRHNTLLPSYIHEKEFNSFVEEIAQLAQHVGDASISIPFVFHKDGHNVAAMFEISKDKNELYWVDSLGDRPDKKVLGSLSQLSPKVATYYSDKKMQHSKTGCSVFANNSVSELLSSEQYLPEKYTSPEMSGDRPLTQYVKQHITQEESIKDKKGNRHQVYAVTFPARMYRSAQASILRNTIVEKLDVDEADIYAKMKGTKVGATEQSKDLKAAFEQHRSSLMEDGKGSKQNRRLDHKFERTYQRNAAFIENHTPEQIVSATNDVTLEGFKQQVAHKIEELERQQQTEKTWQQKANPHAQEHSSTTKIPSSWQNKINTGPTSKERH